MKQCRSEDIKKKKIVGAVELTGEDKVKRAYFKKIDDYSSVSFRLIFADHISTRAQVFTDKWTGYKPLKKSYKIVDKYSEKGNSMKQMHTIIPTKVLVEIYLLLGTPGAYRKIAK